MKKTLTLLFLVSGLGFLSARAQTIQTIATGLSGPAGITADQNGNLFVAESGSGANDGKITLIDPSGARHTIIYGLPSFTDTTTGETSGPWRAYITTDSILYVIQGKGPDPAAGSILAFGIDTLVPGTDSLTMSDTLGTVNVQQWALTHGFSDSNIYSADIDSEDNVYVADAGANAILKIDTALTISVLDTFPAIPNTITPFPPFIEYVPTKIIASQNTFYICNLTGFPFLPGLSQVVSMDTAGTITPMYSGLSLAVDMQMDDAGNLYVLQFGLYDTTFTPVMGSASIVRIAPGGVMDTLATGFGPSAGFVRDTSDGFYVTELMTGNVIHITNTTAAVSELPQVLSGLRAFPNPFDDKVTVSFNLGENAPVEYSILDANGKTVATVNAGLRMKGSNKLSIDIPSIAGDKLSSGLYFLYIVTGGKGQTLQLLRK